MENRVCFRMPTERVAVWIPDSVITIKDLKRHVRNIYDIPSSTAFLLRAWTRKRSVNTTINFRCDEHIKDLEDNHNGPRPLTIVFRWADTAEGKRQRRGRKRVEIDERPCGSCNLAECDGMSCIPLDAAHIKRQRRARQRVENSNHHRCCSYFHGHSDKVFG